MFRTHISDVLGYLLIGPIGWSWKYFISGKKIILSETYVAPKLNSGNKGRSPVPNRLVFFHIV